MEIIAETARRMGDGTGFPIVFATYMSMLLIERLAYMLHPGETWNERDAMANVLNSSFKAVFEALVSGGLFIGAYVLLYEHMRLAVVPFLWWGWILAFFLNDLAYYVDHRLAHRTGLFWAIHVPHHSSREMNLLVANRGTILDGGGLTSPFLMSLAIIGVHPAMFLAVKFFANLWGIFNHTRLVGRLGVLEGVLATPANHRVHHGIDPKYIDRNYGQVLIIWDRLLGTWQREEEAPTYGLVHQLESRSLWDIQTSGVQWLVVRIRCAPRMGDKLRYLLKPPGWIHTANAASRPPM